MLRHLNQAILSLAPAFDARDHAPASFSELRQCERMVVWAGASERTIYRDPRVNWAFRAWHDAAHLAIDAPFTLAGERAACEYQIAELLRAFPCAPASAVHLIRREVIGQAEHFAATGQFPADQIAFHSLKGT